MTDEAIETLLAEFREWLRGNGNAEPDARPPDLVGEFTALRHEVKLLTRATRAQNEQMAALLEGSTLAADENVTDDQRSFATAVVELTDTLDRSVESAARLADDWNSNGRRSWWPFGRAADELRRRSYEQLQALVDGLRLARNRIVLNLSRLELTPIEGVGSPFNPETMEALEVVADSGEPAGTVLSVVRSGYHWRGKPLRFAQVRVAK